MSTLLNREVLMSEALKILADYRCSEAYLKQALKKRFANFSDTDKAINALMIRLKGLNLLSDTFHAESIALRYIDKGNHFIFNKLKEKGFNEKVIATVINRLEDEHQRALAVVQKKAQHSKEPLSAPSLFRFLSNRRFSFDVINQVSNTFLG